MDATMYGRALERTREVVAGTRPDQLEDPTPCSDWNVHELLNHLIGGCLSVAAGAKGGTEQMSEEIDRVQGDHLAAYDRASLAALEAFKEDGSLKKKFTMPWGETPGAAALSLAIADAAVHGWDLAQATGQKMVIDDDIAEAVYLATSS
ncbi:MAG: TIGR03086 family metal-binding protein, partial [Actinomycetota bacterium]|nr:TIGR03086 family metal-binding protein [Actinomycetota bacterium]